MCNTVCGSLYRPRSFAYLSSIVLCLLWRPVSASPDIRRRAKTHQPAGRHGVARGSPGTARGQRGPSEEWSKGHGGTRASSTTHNRRLAVRPSPYLRRRRLKPLDLYRRAVARRGPPPSPIRSHVPLAVTVACRREALSGCALGNTPAPDASCGKRVHCRAAAKASSNREVLLGEGRSDGGSSERCSSSAWFPVTSCSPWRTRQASCPSCCGFPRQQPLPCPPGSQLSRSVSKPLERRYRRLSGQVSDVSYRFRCQCSCRFVW